MKRNLVIGVDPGTHTGLAVYNRETGVFEKLETCNILDAMDTVKRLRHRVHTLVVEDARKVKFGVSKAKSQGAGYVKDQNNIWDIFIKRYQARYGWRVILPRPNKLLLKVDAERFKRITKCELRTSNHGRDAGMLAYTYGK